MASDRPAIKLLLDEHYPGWLADGLCEEGIDAVAVNPHRPDLRNRDDAVVLQSAAEESRVVVTEDVSTLAAAIAMVPEHLGVVYCHHERFPRTPAGLSRLRSALAELARNPPEGLGEHPIVWWLSAPSA